MATFDNIAFVGTPGSKNQKFFVKSTAVNPSKITDIMKNENLTYDDLIATFSVDFRYCVEGEELVENQCDICESGWYSLKVGDTCVPCIENVECLGGNRLEVHGGYWRDSIY